MICEHKFISGPYWITCAGSREEPAYYPPQGVVPVEHCFKCGIIRLSPSFKTQVGLYWNDKVEEKK